MAKGPADTSLMGWLGDFIFGEDNAQPAPQRRPRDPQAPAAPAEKPDRSLSSIGLSQQAIAAGTLQLLGLAGIREAVGDRWEQRSEQIFRLIESVLRKRLDVTDAYYRVDEENFLILFTRLRRREAEFKARVIAEEIEKLIVGEAAEGQDIVVNSCVTEIDRQLVLEKINSLDELLEHVRSSAAADQAAQAAAATAEDDGSLPEIDMDFSGLFQRTSVADYLKGCRVRFRPMFNTRRRVFASFLTSVINDRTGRMALIEDDPYLENPEDFAFALDRFTLGAAMQGLHRMMTAGHEARVVIPVSYETVASSRLRDVYLGRLRGIPSGVCNQIGFALVNVPEGIPAGRLGEIIGYLRPLSAVQVPHMPLNSKLVDAFAASGCFGFSTEAPRGLGDAHRLVGDLVAFARRAAMHRGESVLANVNSHAVLQIALHAGFGVVWGDAVCGMVETPGVTAGLNTAHIVRQG